VQLGGLLDIFGDHHAGHHGLAQGSFEVHNDESGVLISAVLPGYEANSSCKKSEKPLSVRAVGRSLVISGLHHQGPIVSQWQRVFSVPKNSDMGHVSVTYNSSSGNLTVVVPRGNATQPEEECQPEGVVGVVGALPPALRALRIACPALFGKRPRRLMPHAAASHTACAHAGPRSASLHGDVASAIGQQVEQMILQAKKDSEARVRHELNVARTQLQQMVLLQQLEDVRATLASWAIGSLDVCASTPQAGQKIKQLEQKWGSEVKALKQDLHRTILAHNHNSDLMRHHRDALEKARRELDAQPAPKAEQVDAQIEKVDRMLRAGQVWDPGFVSRGNRLAGMELGTPFYHKAKLATLKTAAFRGEAACLGCPHGAAHTAGATGEAIHRFLKRAVSVSLRVSPVPSSQSSVRPCVEAAQLFPNLAGSAPPGASERQRQSKARPQVHQA
ncbi:unnamed protein product, partial [Effrenium voratum]